MKNINTYKSAENDGILLNANELPLNLNGLMIKEIQDVLNDIQFNRYPDNNEDELLSTYANVIKKSKDQLLAGNGSDQILGYLIGTFLGKDKVLYTFDPDFSMYEYYASSYEAIVVKYELNVEKKLNVDDFIAYGKKNNIDMVMFSNPNNPSGMCLDIKDIEKILIAFKDIPVIVDEAYIEFADEISAISLIEKYSNLYVTRTLSKAYGLAGIRIGFLVSSKENMISLKKAFVPYALSSIAQKIGAVVLKHSDEYKNIIKNIIYQRDLIFESIKDFKSIKVYPSQTNFIYGKSKYKNELMKKLNDKNIQIRDYPNSDAFRITIGTNKENKLLLNTITEFEKEIEL